MKERIGGMLIGGLLLLGCGKDSTQARVIQATHVGGAPFSEKWILPIKASVHSTGWWSGESYEILGDTLYTDPTGSCTIPESVGFFDAIMCQPHGDWETPFLVTRFDRAFSANAEVWLFELPQVIWLHVVGNRAGQMLGSRIWITSNWQDMNFEPDQWFTPGQPPRPSYLLPHWVMPGSSDPLNAQLRFQEENDQGSDVVTIEFSPADLLDTITVPLNL